MHAVGFVSDTLLLTSEGQQSIAVVQKGALIVGRADLLQKVLYTHQQEVTEYIKLSVGNETICCHEQQLFWCTNRDDWIAANQLQLGDALLTFDKQLLLIDAVEYVKQEVVMYGLSVESSHFLFVGQQGVLAHNFEPIATIGCLFSFGAGVVEFVSFTFSIGVAIGGAIIGGCFSKKSKQSIECRPVVGKQTFGGPVFFNPNDDDKDKHPHGKYKGSDKHRSYQNNDASPEPKDGQKALDNSIEFNKHSGGRVAIEEDEVVILRRTTKDEYHGYRVKWKELRANETRYRDVIKVLRNHKLMKY
jgi:hypothetical protein